MEKIQLAKILIIINNKHIKGFLGGRLISSKYKTILTILIFTTNSALNIKRDELHTFIFFLQVVIKVGG